MDFQFRRVVTLLTLATLVTSLTGCAGSRQVQCRKLMEVVDQGNLAIASITLFGGLIIQAFVPILIRASESEISPNATMFNRFWMALVIFGLWNALQSVSNRQLDSQPREESLLMILWLLIGMGVCGGASNIVWAWSFTQTKVASSTLAFGLTPLFASTLDWFIWGKRFDTKFGIGMAIAIVGTCVLGARDFSESPLQLQGDSIALLASFLYALFLIFAEKLRTSLTATTIFLWRYSVGLILILPWIIIDGDPIFPSSLVGWLFLIGLALSCAGQVLIIYSLKQLPSGLVALVLLLEPAFTAILAWIIFSEQLGLFNWIVFAVILFGICLAVSSKSSKTENLDGEPEVAIARTVQSRSQ